MQLQAQENFNLELVSNLDYGPLVSDVWGFVAEDGTEYAIVGDRNGTSIVSLLDPENPVEVKYIDGVTSTWRDMKSWEDHVYVTADQGADGLLVIDMSEAPDSINYQLWKPNITINNNTQQLQRCHNLYIDENGYAYLSGCNMNSGGVLIIDVHTDPWNPEFVGAAPAIYSHDNYVLEGIMYSSEIYAGEFAIYDVSDPTNVITLGTQNTTSNFTHNAWASPNNQYLFTTDEVANAYVDAYDVSDPDNIIYLSSFRPRTTEGEGVIPHNAHYHNGYLVVSWYTDGVVVLDVHRPENMVKVGQYDTYLGPNGGFNGCWGATPFLPSGLILASDRQTGLYVLEPTYIRASYLEGHVTSAANGANIVNVEVEILDDFPNETSTGADGLYKTGLPKTGTFSVSFNHPEFIEQIIQIELEAGEITILDVELEPLPCIPPTSQAFNFNLLNVQPDQLELGWMRGSGDQIIVLAKEGSAVDSFPQEGESYQANSEFGLGDEIGNGNFVVYSGVGNSTAVTGLIEQTFYGFAIIEFYTADNCYLLPALFGNGTTTSFTSDVDLEKEGSVSSAFPGDTVVFTFQIFNNGPGEAVNLTLTDSLPEELIYLSSTPLGGHQNGVVTWDLGNLNNGQNLTISLTTVVSTDAEAGIVTNNATVEISNNDPNLSNNSDEAEVEILCLPDHECQENITVFLETDECSAEVAFQGEDCNFNSGDAFPLGETIIECNFVNSCGNQDSCTFTITVLDSIRPLITNCPIQRNIIACSIDELQDPPHSTVASVSSQSVFESPANQGQGEDNCEITSYSYMDEEVTGCPFGFTRTWTISDSSGNTSSCEQFINIQQAVLSLNCPGNQIIEACPGETDLEFDFAEWLSLAQVNGGCDPTLEHDGEAPPSVCGGMVSVSFAVVDTCGQSVDCIAYFTVLSEVVSFECPDDIVVNVDPADCSYLNNGTSMDPALSGICEDFILAYTLTGALEGSGQNTLDGLSFNVGTTTVNWTLSANCIDTACSFVVNLMDLILPSISCPADTTIELSAGMDSIFVNLAEAEAEDNCNLVEIENDWNNAGADASDYFFPGVSLITYTATDGSGNQSSCSTEVKILFEGGLSLFSISGNIQTFTAEPVSELYMMISGSKEDTITVDSEYQLQFIEGSDIILVPEKSGDWGAGLTTFDLVQIQRHILHLERFSNPYQIIAADANNDQKVNAMDLILLQSIILGNLNQINGNKAIRFVDAAYEFDDPENPLEENWPESMVYLDLAEDYLNQNWIVIKTGDVNGSWQSNSRRVISGEYPLYTKYQLDESGDHMVSFFAAAELNLSALQIALQFDPHLFALKNFDFKGTHLSGFSDDWISISDEGLIRLLWYNSEVLQLERGDFLFSIRYGSFENNQKGLIDLSADQSHFNSLAFGPTGEKNRIVLKELLSANEELYALYPNVPNPFSSFTRISWSLPEAMEVELEVFDVLGSLLYSATFDGIKGINQRELLSTEWPSAVLYYRISAGDWSASGKMLKVE